MKNWLCKFYHYHKNIWVFCAVFILLYLPVLSFLLVNCLLLIFIFWPYGSCADSSDNYFDSTDNVPGSNQPLKFGIAKDVTALKEKYGYVGNPHLWPVYYYLEQL